MGRIGKQASTSAPPSRSHARITAQALTPQACRREAAARGVHVVELLEAAGYLTAEERLEYEQRESLAFALAYFPEEKDAFARQRAQERGSDGEREIQRQWRALARRFPKAFASALRLRGSKLRAHLQRRAPSVLRQFAA